MEWLTFLLKGILIGLVAVIPPGPVAVVCVQRTLSRNWRSGFVSGLGAVAGDTLFAIVAVFFLTVVLGFVERYIDLLKVVGGMAAIIFGVTIFLKNPVVQIRRNRAGKGNLWSDFFSVLGLTLANPAFILVYVMWFAAFGIGGDIARAEGTGLIGGVMAGSTLWWTALTFSMSLLHKGFRPRNLLWLNRISGTAIVLLGVAAILSIVVKFPVGG